METTRTKPKYHSVNSQWPEDTNDGRKLKPTPQEAMSAAKRLYRFAMKRPFRGKIKLTSGRNNTWIRSGVMYVNPDAGARIRNKHMGGTVMWPGGGWHELVHDLSHCLAYRLHPGKKPHGMQHAFLEKEMIKHVVESGWLNGKLKREPKPVPDIKTLRQDRIEKRLRSWKAKQSRAERAIAKLERQLKYYKKKMATSIEEVATHPDLSLT